MGSSMKIKVLPVDDSAVVRSMLKRIFVQDERFELCSFAENGAVNGKDAVDLCKKFSPDLIVMDLNMPVMNGIEASREIFKTSNPAIVAFTTEDYADSACECYDAGILEVIKKPDFAVMTQKNLCDFVEKIYFIAQSHIFKSQNLLQKKSCGKNFIDLKNSKTELKNLENFLKVQDNSEKEKPYLILAIASSTGGPRELKNILCGLKKNFPIPIIITQHNDLDFDGYLAKWLGDASGMNIKIAQNGESLLAGKVYIAPSGFHLCIKKSGNNQENLSVFLDSGDAVNFFKPAADKMFESVAKVCGKKSIAVILTGMGKDGGLGLKSVYDAGGFTIAEAEQDCVVYGMPKFAIEKKAVSRVERLSSISKLINSLLSE